MFWGDWVNDWTKEDVEWLAQVHQTQFPKEPTHNRRGAYGPDTERYSLRVMYDGFNAALRQAAPRLKTLATPMWQFPACEGSYAPEIYKDMSESYSHYTSEGFDMPWYAAHNAAFLKRPGLPLIALATAHGGWRNGEGYQKNLMTMLALGAQGAGSQYFGPFETGIASDGIRTANRLAAMYGSIFAEAPALPEAAVLYSYAQDITERRLCMGSSHWERIYALFGAGLMAGVPMEIIYEEDVAAGWLLANGKPRVPIFLLCGQKTPLPGPVQDAILKFVAAGGKLYQDRSDTEAGETRSAPPAKEGAAENRLQPAFITLGTEAVTKPINDNYPSDHWHQHLQPVLTAIAARLHTAVAKDRRFPVDSEDPWLAKTQFDGGAIRYLMFAVETGPYPWSAGQHYSMGEVFTASYTPRQLTVTMPKPAGVVYDVFERKLVLPGSADDRATLTVDFTTFPGHVYALSLAPLGTPQVSATARGTQVAYSVRATDQQGRTLAARVPLRIRLVSDEGLVALEQFRGTDATGAWAGRCDVPAEGAGWRLEACELLSSKTAVCAIPRAEPLGALALPAGPDDLERGERIAALLEQGRKEGVSLALAEEKLLDEVRIGRLRAALNERGVELKGGPRAPQDAVPGVHLAIGRANAGNKELGAILAAARENGQLGAVLTARNPGPGRALITAVHSPRGLREHAIALIGGDDAGVGVAVEAFCTWLDKGTETPQPGAPAGKAAANKGSAAPDTVLPRLSEMTGVPLDRVVVAADGKHLLVTARGYNKNLAVIADTGAGATVVSSVRVGQGRDLSSLFISRDGRFFSAAARTLALGGGTAFALFGADGAMVQGFAPFGRATLARQIYHDMSHDEFAVSEDGNLVLAPGTYGVVCWKRDGESWKETWAVDFWKEFPRLLWPVHQPGRMPHFNAVIPHGAGYALILGSELSDTDYLAMAWHNKAWLMAVDLRDGSIRWRFDVPIPETLIIPALCTSPDGSRLVLRVRIGGWTGQGGQVTQSYRYYALDSGGKVTATWDTPEDQGLVIANETGLIAQLNGRAVVVLAPNGDQIYTRNWPVTPLSLSFAPDNKSLLISDQLGAVVQLDPKGHEQWRRDLGVTSSLSVAGERIYVTGGDGRLRALTPTGAVRWTIDLTPSLRDPDQAALRATLSAKGANYATPPRSPTTQAAAPAGTPVKATFQIEHMEGKAAACLGDGKLDTIATLSLPQPIAVNLPGPTALTSVTVIEPDEPAGSRLTECLIEVPDPTGNAWVTAAYGCFLTGPVNTFVLDGKPVTRLRITPTQQRLGGDGSCRIAEIEVRAK